MAINVLGKLSFGYLADRIAHAFGWSPLARLVSISGAEGPSADLLEGVVGTVRSVHGNVMTLEPDRTGRPSWPEGSHLRLTARHEGWTPFSLCLSPIAVVVEIVQSDGKQGPVAIGLASVVRRRRLAARD